MPFAPGQSGNPNGAPKGKPHTRSANIRALIRDKTGKLIKQTLERAEAGDVESLRLFYKYLMPRLRFISEPITLPVIDSLEEARAQIAKLASLGMQGLIDLDSRIQISRTIAIVGVRDEELEQILSSYEAEQKLVRHDH